jgi:hypothetical protein
MRGKGGGGPRRGGDGGSPRPRPRTPARLACVTRPPPALPMRAPRCQRRRACVRLTRGGGGGRGDGAAGGARSMSSRKRTRTYARAHAHTHAHAHAHLAFLPTRRVPWSSSSSSSAAPRPGLRASARPPPAVRHCRCARRAVNDYAPACGNTGGGERRGAEREVLTSPSCARPRPGPRRRPRAPGSPCVCRPPRDCHGESSPKFVPDSIREAP